MSLAAYVSRVGEGLGCADAFDHIPSALTDKKGQEGSLNNPQPTIANFQAILTVIQVVTKDIAAIGGALAVLALVIAGMFLMFDRGMSYQARTDTKGFMKNVLIGYGVVLAAVFILGTIAQALKVGKII